MAVKVRPYKRGGWEVDITVRLPCGEVIRERKKSPVSTKADTQRWGQERERQLLLNGLQPKKKEVPTLEAFKDRYLDGRCRANREKPSSIASKESMFEHWLLPKLGARSLDAISNEDVQQLKAALACRSPKTTNNVLSLLNTALKSAVEWGVITELPCRIRLLKVTIKDIAFYDFDEYEWLVEAAGKLDARILAVVLLGGQAGLRRGEIVALEWPSVDFRRGLLTVEKAQWKDHVGTPKSGKLRRIPMTARLSGALQALRHLRGERVLYRDDGKPVTYETLRRWFESAQKRAGLRATGGVHILRHTFCSHLAMKGAPVRAIQELAGHAHIHTTQRYMHLSPAALHGAIRLLEGKSTGDMLETGEREREK